MINMTMTTLLIMRMFKFRVVTTISEGGMGSWRGWKQKRNGEGRKVRPRGRGWGYIGHCSIDDSREMRGEG